MSLSKGMVFLLAAAFVGQALPPANLSFEPNQGQTDSRVQFLTRGDGYTLFLTSTEAVLRRGHDVFRMKLAGANPKSKAEGQHPQTATTNYLTGSDPAKWRTGVPNYSRVKFTDVYPGIDLVYYGKGRQLEYDWIVRPGADPAKIRLQFAGAKKMLVDSNGDLVLSTRTGEVRHKSPSIYQDREVAGRYVLRGRREAGFEIARYDATKQLVIDPVLVYSSFLGGSSSDLAQGIAVDAAGNAYVTGFTDSEDFPLLNPLRTTRQGKEIFVTKISADGVTRIYSTYFGGNSDDRGSAIAVDAAGNAYITGVTQSRDFPVVNAYKNALANASSNAFVVKLNPTGSAIIFSTYLGGSRSDAGSAIALDKDGNPFIAGYTFSTDYPTVNPIQPSLMPGDTTPQDAFVTKMSADGSQLVYSTFLGGTGDDSALGIAVDPAGNAYVTGSTVSKDFPVFHSLVPVNKANDKTAFICKLTPTGSAFVYSSYFGGSGPVSATISAVAADTAGNAYITGTTGPATLDFPIVNAAQKKLAGSSDAFVTKIDPTGSSFVYSTYLGGKVPEIAYSIAVNAAGEAWVAGLTNSQDFPTVNAFQSPRDGVNVFVTQLSAGGSSVLFSTQLSGPKPIGDSDEGHAIALDSNGSAYVVGHLLSPNFPIKNPFQPVNGGGGDAFVLKISPERTGPSVNAAVNGASFLSAGMVPGEIVTVFGSNLTSGTGINLSSTLPLPTELLNSKVTIDGVAAPLFAVDNVNGQQQINFQVPWGVSKKPFVTVAVEHGSTGAALLVPVLAAHPGIFNYNVGGNTFGAILHANFQLADSAHPAKAGEIVLIYCTGLGAVSKPPADGAAAIGQSTTVAAKVTIGGSPAAVSFSGLAPGFVGLNQINAQVPTGLSAGNKEVIVSVGDASSNAVLLPVH